MSAPISIDNSTEQPSLTIKNEKGFEDNSNKSQGVDIEESWAHQPRNKLQYVFSF
jgi:hypothetical protein